ncbi:propanediol utilization protein [Levilactobacillus namurensis DSM 19117]|uniref:Propanediol utilization protein n=1 Tax=Levilactobacillus namurensis DSM 19117 TaxID=1423773 RepID=A0A0R1KBJ4_9LACO|nr:BMC domain-containing protein [Levilactobacillus namurensis]KRK77130.1 propanediol utilization protein [Levilactobacillus namurensis DSM 19117]GEO73338.1 hypothetical protein LNA02_00360 [Levilactobacillus namurensis]
MQTIGYIEVSGLTNAIVVADKMLKTAEVELSALDNTKGGGWIMVVIKGDVAAVSVAIEIGKQTVGDAYVGSTVLANPAPGIDGLSQGGLFTTPGPRPDPDPQTPTPTKTSEYSVGKVPQVEVIQPEASGTAPTNGVPVKVQPVGDVTETTKKATCNLCGDPKCSRKLGEPRKKCLHYRELFSKEHK